MNPQESLKCEEKLFNKQQNHGTSKKNIKYKKLEIIFLSNAQEMLCNAGSNATNLNWKNCNFGGGPAPALATCAGGPNNDVVEQGCGVGNGAFDDNSCRAGGVPQVGNVCNVGNGVMTRP